MTKLRAWKCLSVIIALATVLGIGAFALSSVQAQSDEGTWEIEDVDNIDVWTTSLALDSQDYPHISYSTFFEDSLYYTRWTGIAWAKETVDPSEIWTASLALDSGDQPHIGYSKLVDFRYAYLVSGAWTTEPVFPSGPIFVFDCSLALDSSNQPHMSSSLIAPTLFALICVYRTDSGWQFMPPVDETLAFSSSLALDRNDQPRISYTNGHVKYAEWTGTNWALQSVDPDNPGEVGSTSLALDSNGRPHIAYATIYETGSLNYARWTGTAWARETVDPSPYIVDCSLVLDSLNHPHIAYYVFSGIDDGGDSDIVVGMLKYAHWTGSAWEIETLDQESVAADSQFTKTLNQRADILKGKVDLPQFIFYGGKFSSIKVDSHDLPHISYGSLIPAATTTTLHYAHLVVPAALPAPPTGHPRSSPPINWTRPLSPATMSVQFVSVNPHQATANQPVTISTNVVNTGDEAGNLNVSLKVNGRVEQTRMVSVGPQASQPIKFTVTKAEPGTYNIDIADQKGSFTILGDSSSNGATSSKAGAFIALALIGVLIVATLLVLLLRRT
jgi:hypothetical protein